MFFYVLNKEHTKFPYGSSNVCVLQLFQFVTHQNLLNKRPVGGYPSLFSQKHSLLWTLMTEASHSL